MDAGGMVSCGDVVTTVTVGTTVNGGERGPGAVEDDDDEGSNDRGLGRGATDDDIIIRSLRAKVDSVSIDCSKLTASSSLSSNLETRELASSAMSFSPPPLLPGECEGGEVGGVRGQEREAHRDTVHKTVSQQLCVIASHEFYEL